MRIAPNLPLFPPNSPLHRARGDCTPRSQVIAGNAPGFGSCEFQLTAKQALFSVGWPLDAMKRQLHPGGWRRGGGIRIHGMLCIPHCFFGVFSALQALRNPRQNALFKLDFRAQGNGTGRGEAGA